MAVRVSRDLLRHAVPNGGLADILSRALDLLIEDVMRRRFGKRREKRVDYLRSIWEWRAPPATGVRWRVVGEGPAALEPPPAPAPTLRSLRNSRPPGASAQQRSSSRPRPPGMPARTLRSSPAALRARRGEAHDDRALAAPALRWSGHSRVDPARRLERFITPRGVCSFSPGASFRRDVARHARVDLPCGLHRSARHDLAANISQKAPAWGIAPPRDASLARLRAPPSHAPHEISPPQ
jgi:hypothetical protein